MKNKFKKIESGIASAFIEISKHLPLKIALQLDNLRGLIIKDVNIIHQQAMKETRAKDRETVKGLLEKICELERKLIKTT